MIYIVASEMAQPVGGININIQFGEIFARNGHDVALLYETSDYVYPYVSHSLQTAYFPKGPFLESSSLRDRLRRAVRNRKVEKPLRRARSNMLVTPRPDDVIIIPEWAFDTQRIRFRGIPQVLMSQNVFAQIRTTNAIWPDRLDEAADLRGVIATSELCAEAVRVLNDLPCEPVPLALDANRYSFHANKQKKIAYMPRKRGQDAAAMVRLLSNHPAVSNYDFVPIDGLSSKQVDELLAESLIFLSFSVQEGFGLPPAEAMAQGCIVIGYTGVGGNEFFTPDVGFPIAEDDLVAFYRTVLEVAAAYESDPEPLDELRRHASEAILSRYSIESTEDALLRFWKALELSSTPP